MINGKDIIKQNIYIVERLSYPISDSIVTVRYADLRTVYGQALPKFTNPPSLMIAPRGYFIPLVKEINNQTFQILVTNTLVNDGGNVEFDLWITSK